MKKTTCFFLALTICFAAFVSSRINGYADVEHGNGAEIDLKDVSSAILMDAGSGEVLYEYNADERRPPASVTKIMTLLLVMEALDSGKIALDEKIPVSAEAAGMGGSQVYLEPGEEMTADDLIKCVVVASANDAAAALAERVGGTLENFVRMMNDRARELGMKDTVFENTNGLDDTTVDHMTTARDIAVMSRELLKHKKILDYTCIWMDTVRDGAFTLTNTNKLVRYYKGINGLKTGMTSKAGFCISATAERNGLQLIAVIMGSPTAKARNAAAAKLLDYGFSAYENYVFPGDEAEIAVAGGQERTARVAAAPYTMLVKKGESGKVTCRKELPAALDAPVERGSEAGSVTLTLGEREVKIPYTVTEPVARLTFTDIVRGLLGALTLF